METKTSTEIPRFLSYTNKNGYEYKVANHDCPEVIAQSGIVIIEALKRSQLKQPRVSFKKVVDPETGLTYGIPLGIDNKTGELEFQRIILGDVVQFDLANVNDRKLWNVISRHQSMYGSPFQRGIPLFKKIDKNAEADKVISSAKDMVRAVNIAQALTGVELSDMAINLGLSPDHNNIGMLLASVIEKAQKNPEGFLNVYDNVNRNVITVFNRAKSVGLIKLDVTNGFMWKDTHPLGQNEVMAIKTIVSNPSLLVNMDIESKQRSQFYKKNATPEQMQAVKLNKDIYNNPSQNESNETGFVSDSELKAKMDKLDAETQRTKALNDKMEKFLASQEEKETKEIAAKKNDFTGYTTPELQDLAFELGYALAKTVDDRKQLAAEIIKRRK